jgi:hypothetical protein
MYSKDYELNGFTTQIFQGVKGDYEVYAGIPSDEMFLIVAPTSKYNALLAVQQCVKWMEKKRNPAELAMPLGFPMSPSQNKEPQPLPEDFDFADYLVFSYQKW